MKKLLTAFVAGTGLAACAGEAQSTNEVEDLPPVTIYASRIDDTKDSIPAPVAVFTAAEIEASGVRDLPELLKKKAGIGVQSYNGNPLLTSVSMRGFGENAYGRVRIVLDGEDLNNVDMNAPNIARIPIWNVERVEIIHGPSPVLYGDGAVAGVVNIVTDTKDYEKKTRITGRAGSQNTFGGTVQTKGGFEPEGVLYSASYDYLQSEGYRERSAYRMHTANAGVRKNFENGSTIGFKANYQNAFYELPGSLTYDQWKSGRRSANVRDDAVRMRNYAMSIDSKMKIAEDQWLYLDGGFSHQFRRCTEPGAFKHLQYDYYRYQLSPRYVNEMAVAGFDNKFTVGLDFRYDLYNERHPMFWWPGTRVKRHFSRDRYAAFVQDEFSLTENLSVLAGARLERIGNHWKDYAGLNQTDGHDWKGDYELGLVYRPVDGLKTYVKGTRFHRSAFCDELSWTPTGRFLKPETGTSLDVGAEWTFLKEFTFNVNGYGSVMEDEIFYHPWFSAPPPWSGFNCNSPSKTRRIGLDTSFSWLRDKVAEASIRYGLVHADFGKGPYHGNDVPLVPNHRIRAEAGFWAFSDLEIKGGFSFVGSQWLGEDFGNDENKLEAYLLFDIGAYYEPSWAKGWRASFVIDNIFDRDYCEYAFNYGPGALAYYPAVGRSFMFTLSYEF